MKYSALLFAVLLTACSSREEKEEKLTDIAQATKTAVADIHSPAQKHIHGTVTIEETTDGLSISTDLSGLKKNSKLGFHIHQNGICEGPDFISAGDHFNPHKSRHGSPESSERHSGDLGNLQTDLDGKSKTKISLKGVTLDEVMGKAILIHAKPDDLKTQPSGNSGARIACGLIRPLQ